MMTEIEKADLMQRLTVAAGMERDGVERAQLDEASDPETEALAKKHGTYADALEAVSRRSTIEPQTTQVRDAIARSIGQTEIVHLTVRSLGDMYEPVIADLERVAEDWVAADELEYWGTDADGDEWRVHMERRQ